jgi:lipoate-protein ligase A
VYFLDLTLSSPQENLALDQALLRTAESEGDSEYLRVWEAARDTVILGKNCELEQDVWTDRCQADGVAILRRFSGGGTVLIGPGCLNYSAVLRYRRAPGLESVTASIQYCIVRLQQTLAGLGIDAEILGSDLMWQGRKFSGSAQRRQQSHFLHHGTILYQFDLAKIVHYLKEPTRQPAHRANRDHLSFLTCIPADPATLAHRLRETWNATQLLDVLP